MSQTSTTTDADRDEQQTTAEDVVDGALTFGTGATGYEVATPTRGDSA